MREKWMERNERELEGWLILHLDRKMGREGNGRRGDWRNKTLYN